MAILTGDVSVDHDVTKDGFVAVKIGNSATAPAGNVLTSNGPGTFPTFQPNAGGGGGSVSNFFSAFPTQGQAIGALDSTGTIMVPVNVDAAGFLKVNVAAGGGSGGTSSTLGAAVPGTGTAAGYSDGANMQLARVFDVDTGAGTQYLIGTNLRRSASGGSVELLGSQLSANSLPVVIASDQGAVAVSGTFFQATQPVSAAALPLPSGAATSAKQPALGTAGTPSTDVITVQGATSMTPLKTDGSGVTQPVSGTVTAVGNVASGASDAGNPVKMGGVFNSSPITLTNGQRGDLQVDANGLLKVTVSGGASGGTSVVDNVTFTRGTTSETPVGGIVETSAPTLTNGRAGALSLNTSGGLRVDGSGVTQPVSGTITANIGTSGSLALDASITALTVSQGSTTSGQKGHLAMGAVTTASPTYTTAQTSPLSLDTTGALRVNVTAGGGAGGTSSSFGSAFPSTGTAIGAKDSTGTNMAALNLDASGFLKVNVAAGGGAGGTSIADAATFTRGTTSETPAGGVAETSAPTLTTGKAAALSLNLSGGLRVDGSGVTQPVSGTVTANIGTSGSLALDATVSSAILSQASTTSGQKGHLAMGATTTAAPTYTTAQTNPLSLNTAGGLRVDGSGVTQPVSGTVTANIGTSGSLALDASITGLQVAQGSTTSGQKGGLAMGAVTTAAPTYTTAQTSPLSLDTAGNLRVNVVTGGGSGGTSLADNATFTRGTTSVTPVAAVVETSAPTLTAGKAAALSVDTSGGLRVNITAGGVSSGTAGSPSANVISIQGITSMTPVTTQDLPVTSGGLSRNYQIAPATPAKTAVKASAGQLYAIKATNNNASPRYIKLFDLASASVSLGTTNCDDQFEIPGNTTGAGFVFNVDKGIAFATAITAAITGAIASNDNTAISANEVIVTFYYK